ncbi:MAG: class I SAM-dependent methyltransferase [Solirubrobacteraceae bacterium]
MSAADAVIWHDLECGGYRADLPHWLALAERHAGAVLDVGAGTGRVALALARAGHSVLALERDAALAGELARRAEGLAVEVIRADACSFTLAAPVALAIVPMQTIHLFADRDAFLRCARGSLAPGGLLAVALLGEGVEPFELELEPDVVQIHALRYESTPTALRRDGGAVLLERRRTRIAAGGARFAAIDVTRLEPCDGATLAAQARAAGFEPLESIVIEPTVEHVGSEIVCLGVPA